MRSLKGSTLHKTSKFLAFLNPKTSRCLEDVFTFPCFRGGFKMSVFGGSLVVYKIVTDHPTFVSQNPRMFRAGGGKFLYVNLVPSVHHSAE